MISTTILMYYIYCLTAAHSYDYEHQIGQRLQRPCHVVGVCCPRVSFEALRKTTKTREQYILLGPIRGVADKSLARPTSRFRRTEWIVSLERGVCSCAELQVFSCYRGSKKACQVTSAISYWNSVPPEYETGVQPFQHNIQ